MRFYRDHIPEAFCQKGIVMGPTGKIIVGGLAVLGGALLLGVALAPAMSLSLYSPYMPKQDLMKVRGSTLLKLIAHGGGETPPTTSSGMPFPIALRFRMFDTSTSVAEEGYEAITGKQFSAGKFLFG